MKSDSPSPSLKTQDQAAQGTEFTPDFILQLKQPYGAPTAIVKAERIGDWCVSECVCLECSGGFFAATHIPSTFAACMHQPLPVAREIAVNLNAELPRFRKWNSAAMQSRKNKILARRIIADAILFHGRATVQSLETQQAETEQPTGRREK